MSITSTVNFGAKGQVVIPRRLRTEFEIEEGTRAQVYAENGHIVLKPITAKYIKSLRGKYKHLGLMKAFNQSRKEDRARDW
ncbi:MAG: AbrB/MazE/SpoVT family DNA-binding domain-containing protein [Verrucomicrobiota bacterium]|nr:AbrB/MazE/SpoVT family DNA-binding domain-containing protein [Verrucomicrobiota bacterium]